MGRPHGRRDDNIGNDGNGHRRVRQRPAGWRRIGASGFLPAIVMASVLAAGGTVAALAASGSSGPSLTVSYQTTSSWGTGYTGLYTITNDGAAATAGWTLGFRLPGGASLSSLWNGTDEVSGGQVTVTNAGWDGTIEPGAAANVGLVVEGSAAAPADCTINGAPCQPGGGSTGSPTPSPSATAPDADANGHAEQQPVSVAVLPGAVALPEPGGRDRRWLRPVRGHQPVPAVRLTSVAAAPASRVQPGIRGRPAAAAPRNGAASAPSATTRSPPRSARCARWAATSGSPSAARTAASWRRPAQLRQLAAAYQQVIDAYGLNKIDFDIEGAAIDRHRRPTPSGTRRWPSSEAQDRGLQVSFTLPVLPPG